MGGVRVSGPGRLNHRFMLTLMTPSAPILAASWLAPLPVLLYRRELIAVLAPAFFGGVISLYREGDVCLQNVFPFLFSPERLIVPFFHPSLKSGVRTSVQVRRMSKHVGRMTVSINLRAIAFQQAFLELVTNIVLFIKWMSNWGTKIQHHSRIVAVIVEVITENMLRGPHPPSWLMIKAMDIIEISEAPMKIFRRLFLFSL